MERTINKQVCECCGQSINERQIGLFVGMIEALFLVYKWCMDRGIHEFKRKEIKHLFKNENMTARFGDWVFFGGLVYKSDKGSYGLNIERCQDFFSGRSAIPSLITKNPMTGEIKKYNERFIHEVPHLSSFLSDNQDFIARYGEPKQQELV